MRSLLSFFVLLLATVVAAVSSTGERLLVILDDLEDKSKYTKFLGDLQGRGFTLSYSTPKTDSLALFKHGQRTFDHVVLFPTKGKGLGPNLTPNILVQFVKEDGNILLALSSETTVSTSIVSLLHELDIHVPADRTGLVVDHFNYDVSSAPELHDVVLVPASNPLRAGTKDIFGPGPKGDASSLLAFPRALGQVLGPAPLLNPVVRAPRTAYSYNPKEQGETVGGNPEDLFAAGAQLSLVSTAQSRSSARLAVVGSAEMLSDTWFDAKVKKAGESAQVGTYNREFAKKLSGWVFKELGVLRVNWVEHHLDEAGAAGNVSNPSIYRVKNDVTYTISLSEYDGTAWGPFTVPEGDELQLEFSMLSPFHRLPLKPAASQPAKDATAYTVSFMTPDQHGIFNFKVNYKRPFFTNIDTKDTVSVRHMAHDEWPRSFVISAAWPWITGIGATVTGWLAFVIIFMFSAPASRTTVSKKTQ